MSWLEPARAFVKSLNHATELVQSGDKSEMTTFLKQIGSNHILFDKSISFSPKNEYKFAAERSEAASNHLKNPDWRRRWDSNPRELFKLRGLATPRNGPAMRHLHLFFISLNKSLICCLINLLPSVVFRYFSRLIASDFNKYAS